MAETKAKEAKSKVRTNYLKMIAIQQLRGEQSTTSSYHWKFMYRFICSRASTTDTG